jgi:uncharacterized SAM-binding protein YcdF (DUF218 family)
VVLLALGAWLYVWPPAGTPLPAGPVVVLGGGSDRLERGREIVDEVGAGRELVLSAGSISKWEKAGGSCGDEGVRCVDPYPVNTFGEAVTVDRLAADDGWAQVTVVTSEYHVTRARLLFNRCVDAEVRVVASESDRSVWGRVAGAYREILGTVDATRRVLANC